MHWRLENASSTCNLTSGSATVGVKLLKRPVVVETTYQTTSDRRPWRQFTALQRRRNLSPCLSLLFWITCITTSLSFQTVARPRPPIKTLSSVRKHPSKVLWFILFTSSQPFNEMFIFSSKSHCSNNTFTDVHFTLHRCNRRILNKYKHYF